jgi:hypothetical protein
MEFIQNLSPLSLVISISVISLVLGLGIAFLFRNKNSDTSTNEKVVEETTTDSNSPHKDYGTLDTTRAMEEFGLEGEELDDFMQDLKTQIDEELPLIEQYFAEKNWKELKDSVHKIKGSAVNLGENGIATLLFDFNHYLAEGNTDSKEIQFMIDDIYYYKEKI